MRVSELLKYHGNVNRILEMHAAGVGVNGIAGTFKDYGIDITPTQVRAIIDSHQPLSAKALPKAASRAQIEAVQRNAATENDSYGGLAPA